MKKIFWLLWLLPFISQAQQSYTVSNRPGVSADFATLQGAIDSVAAGSTLFVFPSPVEYGNVILTKKLSIIGTGFMLDLNNIPYASPNQEGVSLSSVWFRPGSDNSYIQGLQLIGQTQWTRFWRFLLDTVSNVTINRCLGEIWPAYPDGNVVIQTRNTTNCTISQCYLLEMNIGASTHSGGNTYAEYGTGSQNLQFTNNIFDTRSTGGPFTFNYNVNPSYYGNVIFTNNTFNGNINNSSFCNYTYINNLFVSTTPTATIYANSGLKGTAGFNITNLTGLFPANGNNYEGANPDSLLVRADFGFHSFDQGLQVRSGNFAKTYASDGGEVGAYGGFNPYVLSGIPALPAIYSVSVRRDTVTHGNALVHIRAQAAY